MKILSTENHSQKLFFPGKIHAQLQLLSAIKDANSARPSRNKQRARDSFSLSAPRREAAAGRNVTTVHTMAQVPAVDAAAAATSHFRAHIPKFNFKGKASIFAATDADCNISDGWFPLVVVCPDDDWPALRRRRRRPSGKPCGTLCVL